VRHFYSIIAYATTSQQYEDPLIFIEPGMNAFTITTDDVDALVDRLKADGHRIDEVFQLDGEGQHIGDPGTQIPPSTSSS
jgi:hypothetical protein